MKPFFITASCCALAIFASTGCTKAPKPSRLAALKSRTIPAAAMVPVAPVATPTPAPIEEVPATPAPAPVAEVPAKRVRQANVPPWQQLVADMTKDEVEAFVGKPNAMSESKWVYKGGGSVRFSDKGLLSSYEMPRR